MQINKERHENNQFTLIYISPSINQQIKCLKELIDEAIMFIII